VSSVPDGVIRVIPYKTSVEVLADQIRRKVGRDLEGIGWRSNAIAMNACREAAGIAVFDPSGFSCKADLHVSTTDRTLSRSAHAKTPWTLHVMELDYNGPPIEWAVSDDGLDGGRLYLFPTLATPPTESQSDPHRTLSPSSPE
jgi:hypothetical protein